MTKHDVEVSYTFRTREGSHAARRMLRRMPWTGDAPTDVATAQRRTQRFHGGKVRVITIESKGESE